jgi:filamentous hemagglutinin family protein
MKHPFAVSKLSTPTKLILVTVSITLTALLSTLPGVAQTVTTHITSTTGAGDLGTVVPPPVDHVYNINGGTVRGGANGSNLFHSFGDFNLAANDIASFNNTTGVAHIANVLSRVTGENPSYLFGTMRSTIDGAKFFFLNPHGVIFGTDALLKMSGAAYFTTANHISLTDGVKFDMAATPALLTSAPVASFGFLGPDAASIFVQGSTLTVAEGQTLALIGGDRQFFGPEGEMVPSGVTVSGGTLSAPSGQVHLVSVASAGYVTMPTDGVPGLGVQTFSNLGKVELSSGALLNASTLTDIDGIPLSTNGGGTVSIRDGQFVMKTSSITANTLSSGDGVQTAVSIQTSGDITITNGSSIWSNPCFAFPCGTGRTGDIQITGQKVLIEDASLIYTATATDVPTVTPESTRPVGGNISITASEFEVMSGSVINTESAGLGDGGTISITTTNHVIIAGVDPIFGTESQIGTFVTSETGKGGTIEIWSPKITVEDLGSLNTFAGSRRSGALSLHVDELTVSRGGRIGSQGGDLSIQGFTLADARDVSLFGYGEGNRESRIDMIGGGATEGGEDTGAGTLSIKTARLSLTDDARINSEANTLGGGLITIGATESITVANGAKIRVSGGNGGSLEMTSPTILLDRGSFQTTSGPGLVSGPVTINTRSLTLQNGGQINSGASAFAGPTEGGGSVTVQGSQGAGSGADSILITGRDSAGNASGITTATSQSLPGGDITLNARTVMLQNGGILNSTTAGTTLEAVGGNIKISSSQSVQISDGAHISASSTGLGNAGNIFINAGNQLMLQNSLITTQASQANGGNIDIHAIDRVHLVNSQISSSVQGGPGTAGGNITIDPNLVILQNSQILAQAIQGNGGNITIFTPLFLADSSSLVSASSQFGLNGTVTIQSPTSNLSGSLGTLPSNPSQAQILLTQRCAALANGQASSFVVAGRDQLPADPGGWLSSPLALAGIDTDRFGEGTVADGTSNLAPRTSGLLANDTVSLRRLTPAGFLIANFADSEATGCHS